MTIQAFKELKTELNEIRGNFKISTKLIKKIATIASKDCNRPNLQQVYVEHYKDSLNIVATDGHRLVLYTQESSFHSDKKLTISLNVDWLKAIGAKDDFTISVRQEEIKAYSITKTQQVIYTPYILDLSFPDYRKIVKECSGKTLTPCAFNPKYLRDGCDLMLAISKDVTVKLAISDDNKSPITLDHTNDKFRVQYITMPINDTGKK